MCHVLCAPTHPGTSELTMSCSARRKVRWEGSEESAGGRKYRRSGHLGSLPVGWLGEGWGLLSYNCGEGVGQDAWVLSLVG